MQKLINIGAAAVIVSLILYSCSLLKSLKDVEDKGFICSNYSGAAVNEMDKKNVLAMIHNYHAKQYAGINANHDMLFDAAAPKDSRAVFFSLDTLKRLIYNIEKGSKKFSPADRTNLGVNIYFASYPKSMGVIKNSISYTDRHTLIFIPSIFDNTTMQAKDFDLNSSLSGASPLTPKYINEAFLLNPAITSFSGIMPVIAGNTNASEDMSSQNHGTTIPPPPSRTGNIILDITE